MHLSSLSVGVGYLLKLFGEFLGTKKIAIVEIQNIVKFKVINYILFDIHKVSALATFLRFRRNLLSRLKNDGRLFSREVLRST